MVVDDGYDLDLVHCAVGQSNSFQLAVATQFAKHSKLSSSRIRRSNAPERKREREGSIHPLRQFATLPWMGGWSYTSTANASR